MTKKIKKDKDRIPKCYNRIYPILIMVAVIFMGVGYAKVNNVNMSITGNLTAIIPDSIYISSSSVSGGTNGANTGASTVSNSGLMLTSNIELSPTNLNSTITLQVEIKNSTDTLEYFDELLVSSSFYSNPNIDYTLSGLTHGDSLGPDEVITTTLTFKYSDAYKGSNPTSPYTNTLDSVIEYSFDEVITTEYPVTITGVSFTPTSSELHADLGETYTLDFRTNEYYLNIAMNGTTLIENTDYTFSSAGVLNIPNVTGPITIHAVQKTTYNFIIDKPVNVHTISGQSSITNTSAMTANTISTKNINKIVINFNYSSGNKNYSVVVRLKVDGTEIKNQTFSFQSGGQNVQATITFDQINIEAYKDITIEYDNSSSVTQGNKNLTVDEITYNITFAD